MSARYHLTCTEHGCRVVELATDAPVTEVLPWAEATRLVREMNGPAEAAAPAPCCGHAETAERYRHALAQIARHTECEHARHIAVNALMGGKNAV